MPTATTAAPPGTKHSPDQAPTAGEYLQALATTITATPADASTGRYAYHHLRRWVLDTTGTPAPRPNTPVVVAIEIHRWAADDGSGLGIDAQLDPDYHLTGADPNHRSTDAEFARARTIRTTYRAGQLSSPIRAPLATDPIALARQLAVDPLPDGPQATLRAIDELYTAHYVDQPVRAAVLQVLAGIDGLTIHREVTDRLGRTGVAVSLDARNTRYSLTFDPATGTLLAVEQRLIGPHDYLPVPTGLVTYYTLFVDQARRTQPN